MEIKDKLEKLKEIKNMRKFLNKEYDTIMKEIKEEYKSKYEILYYFSYKDAKYSSFYRSVYFSSEEILKEHLSKYQYKNIEIKFDLSTSVDDNGLYLVINKPCSIHSIQGKCPDHEEHKNREYPYSD